MLLEPTGLITHADLESNGLSANDIRVKLRSGQLERVRRGIYRPAGDREAVVAHRQLVNAALSEVHPASVVSHISAGLLHALPVPKSALNQVSITRRSPGHGKRGKHLVIRNSRLHDDEVTLIGNIPVTTLGRTAADLARISPFPWGVMAADAALKQDLAPHELSAALERHPKLHGLTRARSVVEFADKRSESAAESMSRAMMSLQGLPMPEPQFEIFDENGEFVARCDFGWPELRLVGEMDGKGKYDTLLAPGETAADVVMREKLREERIRQQGYWIVRWDWTTACDGVALAALLRRVMGIQARHLGLA